MQNLKRDNLIFGRYRLQQSLGKGSFGEVFYAEDLQFDPPRAVAFKLLHPQYTTDPQVREDLKREAGVLARFDHPNILNVLDFGITEEIAFIVMELAQGGSLARRLRPDPTKPPIPLPLPEVANYLDQMADALDEAHEQGLIHRDIKPQNILLDRRGRILVADFGLATAVTGSSSSVMVDTSGSGTPLYMSPEQWQGRAGRASDIYSLGAVLFQMVSGYPPFQGNQFELFGQHLNTPVPRLSERAPGLVYPPALDDVIAYAMAKDPRQRVRPAKELARLFRAALDTGASGLPMHSQPTISVTPVTPRPPVSPQNAGNNTPSQGRPPVNSPFNPPLSSTSSGAGSSYPPGSISGSNFPANPAASNYQPNNFNQPGQNPPRLYENKPNPGSTPPGTYQGGNPAATNSFPPYQGPGTQSPPPSTTAYQPASTPGYPASGSQPRPAPTIPPAGPVVPVTQPEPGKERKGIPAWVWIVVALVILLVAGGATFLVINANNSNQPGTNTAQVTATPPGPTTTGTTIASTRGATTAAVTTAPATTPTATTARATAADTTQAATTAAPDTTEAATTAPATTPPPTTAGPTSTPAPYGANFATFQAHNDIVLNMAYSPDGKTLATASEDGTVKLWDTATNRSTVTLSGHEGPVRAVAFSPNGKYLVTGSADKTAIVWDLSNNSKKFTLTGQSATITSVAFNPDSNSLATGSDDQTVYLWKMDNGQKFGATFNIKDNVTALAYAPSGKTLAVGSKNGSLKLFDLGNAQPKPDPVGKGHDGTIWSLAFSHNGKFLASGSLDKTTRLWNIDGDKVSLGFVFDDSTLGIRQVAFTPDDNHLASACDDSNVYIWDTVSGNGVTKLTGFTKGVYSVAISPDGKTAAGGAVDGVVKLWSLVK